MDLSKVKKSRNLEDHTGYTQGQKWLDWFFTNLNPKYAYDKLKYGPTRRQNVKLDQVPTSQNFEDRTGEPKDPKMWKDLQRQLLFEFLKRQLPKGELLKTQDHRLMHVDPILNVAHDPFGMKK